MKKKDVDLIFELLTCSIFFAEAIKSRDKELEKYYKDKIDKIYKKLVD